LVQKGKLGFVIQDKFDPISRLIPLSVIPLSITHLYNKRVCPTKNEPQLGISYLEKEREGVRERETGVGRVSRPTARHIKGLVTFGIDS
jgi:hypothetical protein